MKTPKIQYQNELFWYFGIFFAVLGILKKNEENICEKNWKKKYEKLAVEARRYVVTGWNARFIQGI